MRNARERAWAVVGRALLKGDKETEGDRETKKRSREEDDEEKDEFEELIKKYVRGEAKRQLNVELTGAGLKKDEQPSQASSS